MDYNRDYPIRANSYFNKADIKFFISEITSLDKLNDNDVDTMYKSYLKMYESGNGLYRTEGTIVSKSVALRYIMEKYELVGFKIEVKTDLTSETGVLIKPSYNVNGG